MRDFFNSTRKDLKSYLSEISESVVHAVSLLKYVYKNAPAKPWETPTLSIKLKKIINNSFYLKPLEIICFQESKL
ncbi:hypothetical protein KAJ27_00140, partial [bacterium]|nr:hypothetical protein [bacterium]